MALPYSSTIRERDYGLSAITSEIGGYDFGSAESSLSYFQDLLL